MYGGVGFWEGLFPLIFVLPQIILLIYVVWLIRRLVIATESISAALTDRSVARDAGLGIGRHADAPERG